MNSPTYSHPGLGARDVAAVLARAGFDVGPRRRTRRTLLDTFDGRLHAADLRPEFRDDDRRELILAEGSSPRAHSRRGCSHLWRRSSGRTVRGSPLAGHRGPRAVAGPDGDLAQRSVAVRRDAHGKTEIAVVIEDQIAVDGKALTSPACFVEVEDLEGYAKAARQTNELLVILGLSACGADVLGLAEATAGVDLRGYDGSPTVFLDRHEAAVDAFRRVLARLADHVDANWTGAVGDVDPEFLHDLRVAVRRTRSVLAEGKQVLAAAQRAHFSRNSPGWAQRQDQPGTWMST